MLPIILLGAAVGAAMVSSNKSIAKQVIKKEPTLPIDPIKVEPTPIKVEPIKVDPIKIDPIKVTPIVGTKPTDLESIFTDIVDASIYKKSTTKTGTVVIGALEGSFDRVKKGSIYIPPLDKGEFVPDKPKLKGRIYIPPLDKGEFVPDKPKLKGSIFIPPLDKGEFVPDKPKLKGSIYVAPLDKGSFDKPKLKGSIYIPPIDKGEFVPDKAKLKGSVYVAPLEKGSYDKPKKKGSIIIGTLESLTKKGTNWETEKSWGQQITIPAITLTNPKKAKGTVVVPPVGYNADGTKIEDPNKDGGFNAGNVGGGGGGGGGSIGDGGGGSGGSGGGGGMGWGGLSWGITFPTTSKKSVEIYVEDLGGEFVAEQK
jgi:uncharacterized membrane protein YgcG